MQRLIFRPSGSSSQHKELQPITRGFDLAVLTRDATLRMRFPLGEFDEHLAPSLHARSSALHLLSRVRSIPTARWQSDMG